MVKKSAVKTEKKFDVRTHILVPKHIKMTPEEMEELMKQFNIDKKQLPKIKRTDPALEGMSVEKGDIIKIVRKSPTVGESFFYRVVVA
ncbi:DNA-directed RNA polymerase subunit H [Candidatus Woesearchaeota archaeon]|nr:DNA-directed RNA polymerase subunit H [Candidatus Woesearchaeota archaeon]